MDGVISAEQLGVFFACAPLVLGVLIYAIAWVVKRNEFALSPAVANGATFACANCGKSGEREHMVAQTHEGAVSYYCAHCAKG